MLGKTLKGPGVGLTDVLRATEYVVPAIEIVDARVQDPRKIFDTVSDNGAAAGIVIGGRPVRPDGRRSALGRRHHVPQFRDRGDRRRRRRARPSGARAWRGSPTSSASTASRSSRATSCWRARSRAWCSRKKGDTLHADFGPLGGISVQFV